MGRKICAWLGWILAAILLYFFENNTGTRAVLLISLLVPLLSMGCARMAAKRMTVTLQAPESVQAGESIRCKVQAHMTGWAAGCSAAWVLTGCNRLTGETFETEIHPDGRGDCVFEVESRRCGLIRLAVSCTEVRDWFALTKIRRDIRAEASVLVEPALYPVVLSAEPDNGACSREEGGNHRRAADPEPGDLREYMPGDDNRLVSVSNYGEILLNERQGDRLLTKVLLKNSDYDFRDVIISKTGRIYAVSRTGHLAIIQEDLKTVKIIDLDKIEHPMRLHDISDNNLLIIGENSMGLFDMKRNIIRGTRPLGFHVIKGSRKSGLPLLFDNQGKMHLVSGLDNIKTEDVPVTGTVTAHCESKNTGIEAYGMSDGTIWLIQKDGKKQKLLGHRSRISKMKLNGRRLFSSSYDGKVNLWITDKEKIEPMTLIETKNWIMHFNFDSTKTTFWMGDAKGGLTAVNISVPIMVNSVKQKLTRNLTADEWNYFIGQSVPYESFIVKSE